MVSIDSRLRWNDEKGCCVVKLITLSASGGWQAMEFIYWAITWACHRKCTHCYDDRFRPYVRDALDDVVGEGRAAYRAIIDNLPDDFTYLDPRKPDADGNPQRMRGTLILSGGEVLIDPVRETLFYPLLEAVEERYGKGQGPRLACQTTGDILTERYLEEMLERGMWKIAIASMDDYHVGHEGDKKWAVADRIRKTMEKFGVQEQRLDVLPGRDRPAVDYENDDGPFFLFFGAQPELWIGELWPRGRAWTNGLSNATYETNFCARRSGAKAFLDYGHKASEVAIEPDGSVYPCCIKTKAPLGNLTEERLTDILDSLRGHPAMEALNAGDPESMGEWAGWSRDAFRTASATIDPKGRAFENLCIGCDAFFEAQLGDVVREIRTKRLASKMNSASSALVM
jgi:hypothetical protein